MIRARLRWGALIRAALLVLVIVGLLVFVHPIACSVLLALTFVCWLVALFWQEPGEQTGFIE